MMNASTTTSFGKRAWLLAALGGAAVLICLLMASASPTKASAAGKRCSGAEATLQNASKKKVRNGLECLIAKARQKAGVHKLSTDLDVQEVSKHHAHKMVKTACFRHVCTGEGSIPTRLKRAGYLDGVKTYGFGEDTGCATSPKAMVKAWLKSKYHRENMLGARFRDIGIGIAKGVPDVPGTCEEDDAMTFSVLFTWRTR